MWQFLSNEGAENPSPFRGWDECDSRVGITL